VISGIAFAHSRSGSRPESSRANTARLCSLQW
jgi:hypothetical protein